MMNGTKFLKFRKLNSSECFYEDSQSEFQSFIICYWLTLGSKNEISDGQIEEALRILSRNIDLLQLCIRKENGVHWFYKMEEMRIPLKSGPYRRGQMASLQEEKILPFRLPRAQAERTARLRGSKYSLIILNTQSPSEVFTDEVRTKIDSTTGPLWRVSYFRNNEIIKEEDTFTSNILFTFHHAIVDAYTILSICNSFLRVLNDVIGKNEQNIYEFGQFCDGQEIEDLRRQRMKFLMQNPKYLKNFEIFQTKFDNVKLLIQEYFPVSNAVQNKTKFIHGEMDIETTSKLIKLFKSKEISFHAGFSSIFNLVLLDIFSEKGLTRKEIELPTIHLVNLRRYWKRSFKGQMGSQVALIKILSKTEKNASENIWEYAKYFNKELKDAIKNMQPVDNAIAHKLRNTAQDLTYIEESQEHLSKPTENAFLPNAYYATSNMGDISSILQKQGDHVHIKNLSRGSSIHNTQHVILISFQTFEGRLSYSMAYSTRLVTDHFVNLCHDQLIDKLKIISNWE